MLVCRIICWGEAEALAKENRGRERAKEREGGRAAEKENEVERAGEEVRWV